MVSARMVRPSSLAVLVLLLLPKQNASDELTRSQCAFDLERGFAAGSWVRAGESSSDDYLQAHRQREADHGKARAVALPGHALSSKRAAHLGNSSSRSSAATHPGARWVWRTTHGACRWRGATMRSFCDSAMRHQLSRVLFIGDSVQLYLCVVPSSSARSTDRARARARSSGVPVIGH